MVAAAAPPLALVTVADSTNAPPGAGALLSTETDTTRSGSSDVAGSGTVTRIAAEQLFAVSDSPSTASAQAP